MRGRRPCGVVWLRHLGRWRVEAAVAGVVLGVSFWGSRGRGRVARGSSRSPLRGPCSGKGAAVGIARSREARGSSGEGRPWQVMPWAGYARSLRETWGDGGSS
jgi:hypothetical protein